MSDPRTMAGLRRLSRRTALGGGASLSIIGLAAAQFAQAAPREGVRAVARGIYVRRGPHEEATPGNLNGIANASFVVGRDAVAITDPGGSLRDGERLRAAVRRITRLPIRYVVIPHVHPDHVFGAAAFEPDAPTFVGHASLPEALAQRAEYYRGRLAQLLGAAASGRAIVPTLLVRDRSQLELGGRSLQVTAHPLAHSDCDLSIFDAQTGTLLAADLLFVGRAPSLDGSVRGWLRVLAELKKMPARRAVPGHGPVSVDWPSAVAPLERYLEALLRETRAAIAAGVEISEAIKTVGRSERGRWKLFEAYHGHNVTKAFKELEWE